MTTQTDIDFLVIENYDLREENTRLRKRLHLNARHTRRIEQARQDAMHLAMVRAAGVHPGREYVARVAGMSQRHWQNAIALLRMARVVVRVRHWVTDDLTAIERRVGTAAQQAQADPQRFFLRLNRHGTR